MTIQYLAKAIYSGLVVFLGGLSAVLVGAGPITGAQWVTIILATVVSVGGVLGLQAAPATVATSTK